MLRTVNIRAFKDQLSAHLRAVRQGDVLLITDRGQVVAEVRQPSFGQGAVDALDEKRRRLADAGTLRLGLQNDPEAYARADVALPADVIGSALAATRGDR